MVARRATPVLLAALGCAAAAVAVWAAAFDWGFARRLDAGALRGFVGVGAHPSVEAPANALAHLADPLPFGLLALALVAVALYRGRPRVALAVPGVLLAANVTTQILKPLLADPRTCTCAGDSTVAAAAWPSGHATAAMSLALCAVLVAPPRLRPTAAVAGSLFSLGVSYALLSQGWHFPSDVVGAYLVAAFYTLVAVAGLRAADARWPARTGREAAARWGSVAAPAAAGVLVAAVPAAAVLLTRPTDVAAFVASNRAFVVVAAGLAVAAAAVAGVFAASLRR
jgi:membrane-associated phospholipid phosphatase